MPSTKAETPSRTERRAVHPDVILGIRCMSLRPVGMDVTIVNVALPAIQHDLHATVAGLQWIMDAYTLVVASLLMLSGSISDRAGRRRIFQLGFPSSSPDRSRAAWPTASGSWSRSARCSDGIEA